MTIMTSQEMIREVMTQLLNKGTAVIPSKKPQSTRGNLWRAARLRGITTWNFKTTKNSVTVTVKPKKE